MAGLRLAFAGAGWIAAVHGLAAHHARGVTVTHVASRSADRAVETARRLGASACRYEDLPAGADAVVVCTPPTTHAAHALRATRHGAAALVEKPLCATLEDADRLAAAEADGARISYAENLAFAPAVQQAVRAAAAIAPVHHVEVRAVQSRPGWGDFLTEAWGGGALFDLGAHPVAVALLLAAPARPVEVAAELTGAGDHPVDEHAVADIRFDSGLRARVVASWAGDSGPVWDAQAASDRGVVRLELLPAVALERDGVPVALPPAGRGVHPQLVELGYLPQMERFAADVRARRPPVLGAAFGRSVLDVTAAAYASGAAGVPVALPFRGRRDRTPLELWRGR